VRLALSECHRFVVADALHVDREVFETLAEWAAEHDLRVQDAIQLAICAFNDWVRDAGPSIPSPAAPANSSQVPGEPLSLDRID
jgi:hypothetical protein